jgi:hypothetical protein
VSGPWRTAVVVAFLAAYALAWVASPWHRPDLTRAPAPPAVHAATAADAQAHLDDQLAAAMTRLRCVPPAAWKAVHPAALPASMILKRDGTFALSTAAWTYPAPRGQWVMALCLKTR